MSGLELFVLFNHTFQFCAGIQVAFKYNQKIIFYAVIFCKNLLNGFFNKYLVCGNTRYVTTCLVVYFIFSFFFITATLFPIQCRNVHVGCFEIKLENKMLRVILFKNFLNVPFFFSNRPSIMDSILMRSKAHEGSVCCANFSPDGEVVVSAGEDENIKVMLVLERSGPNFLKMLSKD